MTETTNDTKPDLAGALVGAATKYAATRITSSLSGNGKNGKSKAEDDDSPGFLSATAQKLGEGASPVKAAIGGATSTVGEKVKGLFGKGSGGGKPKFSNVIEDSYVGAPLSTVYNQWTQFQEFSKFTKAVQSVEQKDETSTNWRAKVGWSRRSWQGKVIEQVPDERIKWTSEGGKGSTKGVVTFHPIGDNLTAVLLNLEYHPQGLVEQLGRPFKTVPRRVHKDLKLFRRYIVSEGEESGAWRGEIRDGEVVSEGDSEEPQDSSDETSEEKEADA